MEELSREFIPGPEFSALAMGSGDLEVLATPAVVAFSENTCKDLIVPSLAATETSVGTQINLQHLQATKIGIPLTVVVHLVERTKNILNYEIEVFSEDRLIAKGQHQRAVVAQERFLNRLNKK